MMRRRSADRPAPPPPRALLGDKLRAHVECDLTAAVAKIVAAEALLRNDEGHAHGMHAQALDDLLKARLLLQRAKQWLAAVGPP